MRGEEWGGVGGRGRERWEAKSGVGWEGMSGVRGDERGGRGEE